MADPTGFQPVDPATAVDIGLKQKYLVKKPRGHKSKTSNGKLPHKVAAKTRKQGSGPRRRSYNTHFHA
jgi:hypothetical protein